MEQFGPFLLDTPLGRGGMGEVVIARTPWPHAPLSALKRLRADIADPATSARFQHEAELALRLDHPHVVGTLGAGRVGGQLYVASELVDGKDTGQIADRLRERGEGAPAAVSVRLLLDGLAGLAYVHAVTEADGRPLKLIHRDLTPGNLLLGYDGVVKIADFGLAKSALSWAITAAEAKLRIGTPSYMAPELVSDNAASPSSDIYGLGAVLYRFLTGAAPYSGPSVEVLRQILRSDPRPLSELRPDLPEWLVRLIASMMARRLSARPKDASALRARLLREAQAANLLVPREEVGRWLVRLFPEQYTRERSERAALLAAEPEATVIGRAQDQLRAPPEAQPSKSSMDLEERAMQRHHLNTNSWDVAPIGGLSELSEEVTHPVSALHWEPETPTEEVFTPAELPTQRPPQAATVSRPSNSPLGPRTPSGAASPDPRAEGGHDPSTDRPSSGAASPAARAEARIISSSPAAKAQPSPALGSPATRGAGQSPAASKSRARPPSSVGSPANRTEARDPSISLIPEGTPLSSYTPPEATPKAGYAALGGMDFELSEGALLKRARGEDPASVPPPLSLRPPELPPPPKGGLGPVKILTLVLLTLAVGVGLGFALARLFSRRLASRRAHAPAFVNTSQFPSSPAPVSVSPPSQALSSARVDR